ncbi:MAG: hypothetical protein HY360_10585 [Verrucomicrobia bacterium]|nr:hypothetical protein [Verrucomicrobiota bacterium]
MEKVWIVLGIISGWLMPLGAEDNLVINGDFEDEIEPWYGQKLAADGEKFVPAPELISHETKDAYNKSKGALKFTFEKDPEFLYHSHNSGAICKLSEMVSAGNKLKVVFYAKSLDGAYHLSVSRLWGGGTATVELSDKWEKHEVILDLESDTNALVFALAPTRQEGIQKLADGVFLLDQVNATVSTK